MIEAILNENMQQGGINHQINQNHKVNTKDIYFISYM